MIPLAALVDSLKRAQAEVRPRMERVVGTLMAENAELSKGMIGHELPIWPPLAPSTVAEKERLGFTGWVSPTDPLLRSGELRESVEPVVHAHFGEVVGEVGTDVPYARDQERGVATDTRSIPPRPFISPPFITMEPRAVAALGELATTLLNPERR